MTAAFDACAAQNVSFLPLAVETLGAWHGDAVEQLKRIGRSLARQTSADEKTVVKHFFQKLGICLQRGNASLIISRQSYFPESELDGQ